MVCRCVSSLLICVVSVSVACRFARSSPVEKTSQIGADGAQAPSSRDFSSSVLSLPSGSHITVHVIQCSRSPRSGRRIFPSRSPTPTNHATPPAPHPLFNRKGIIQRMKPCPSARPGTQGQGRGISQLAAQRKLGKPLTARGAEPLSKPVRRWKIPAPARRI